jgi:hypothetical protein
VTESVKTNKLTDAQIIAIKNSLGRTYQSIGLISESGACVFARAIEKEIRTALATKEA